MKTEIKPQEIFEEKNIGINITFWNNVNISSYMIYNIILGNLLVQIDTNYSHF